MTTPTDHDPAAALASVRHEFGEHGGVNLSIETSSTFTVLEAGTMPEMFQGMRGPDVGGCYLYGRHFNPTVLVLARQLAAMEACESAYCTGSGMAAISAVILQCCNAGEHVVASNTLYGGTWAFLNDFLPAKANITTTFVDTQDEDAVKSAFQSGTRVLYVETISNPTLRVPDLARLADLAHAHDARLVVDNTFAPLVVTPRLHGADVVIHSLTKFINGASDLVAGAVCADRAFIDELFDLHTGALMLLGPTLDPRGAYEIAMRLPHLPIRMREHAARAATFAQRLSDRGLPACYPGLADHPDHEQLSRISNPGFGAGGLLTVDLGTTEKANAFMEHLQNQEGFGYMAVSLGYAETLLSCPAASTSSELDDASLGDAGILPGLVRISVGYTGSLEQRWGQLERSLEAVGL
ncbi:MAG: aminotransferase class I/II-fold pyridoxal phosphate-dependent enzyme [Phycisphaerales bacterium]|jgi:methionine-gamma-lyase|nr:aminotransferase class I/II-fold pyridoxal phosphate-dependent enzyme [Phycisphaerales bacterium]